VGHVEAEHQQPAELQTLLLLAAMVLLLLDVLLALASRPQQLRYHPSSRRRSAGSVCLWKQDVARLRQNWQQQELAGLKQKAAVYLADVSGGLSRWLAEQDCMHVDLSNLLVMQLLGTFQPSSVFCVQHSSPVRPCLTSCRCLLVCLSTSTASASQRSTLFHLPAAAALISVAVMAAAVVAGCMRRMTAVLTCQEAGAGF